MNFNIDTYQLLEGIPSNSGDLTYILETANNKYNNALWKSFTDVLPASNSKNFSSIVQSTGIVVKASVLGAEGKKPLRSFENDSLYTDSIHKIGHGFAVTQSDINTIKELNLINPNIGDRMLEKFLERATAIIGGFHATWNDWIFQALSTQTIVLGPLGAASDKKYTIDLRTPSGNKMVTQGSANWFDADPTKYNILTDLKLMNKKADDVSVNMPADRVFVCSKALFDLIVADAGVVTAIKARMPLQNATNAILTDGEIMAGMRALGLPPIVAIDEVSRIEVDGVPTVDAAKFSTSKISLIPVRRLFDLHNSPSDYLEDKNPATVKSFFEGGLIGALESFASDPISVITNMESWSFPAFKNPKWVVSLNTAAHA